MNEQQLECLLPISRPIDPNDFTLFTRKVMARVVADDETEEARASRLSTAEILSGLWLRTHKVVLVLIILIASICGFTGYAYATGSNPVSLLKRWIVGDEVRLHYQGKVFTYGKQHTYSDAAVTAMNELNAIQEIFNGGTNEFIVPKDGIERVLNPANTPYTYPWIGTVTQISPTTITVMKQYIIGDKMTPDQVMSEQVSLPLSDMNYSIAGKTAVVSGVSVGKLIEVRQASYLRHQIGSTTDPTLVTHYFAYQLNHNLSDIEAATNLDNIYQPANDPLQDLSFDNNPTLCFNDGADICKHEVTAGDSSRSLFGESTDPSTGKEYGHYDNPDVIDFGQGSMSGPNQNHVMRSIEGKLVNINADSLTIKTSSGTVWALGYSAADRLAFTTKYHNTALVVGDDINASVLSNVSDLDNHDIASQYVYQMVRYQNRDDRLDGTNIRHLYRPAR